MHFQLNYLCLMCFQILSVSSRTHKCVWFLALHFSYVITEVMTESQLWTHTFPVLKERKYLSFSGLSSQGTWLYGYFWHTKIKVWDVLIKTFDCKSKDQNSGSLLWILDKSLNLFGLSHSFLILKKKKRVGELVISGSQPAFVLQSLGCFIKSHAQTIP